MARVGLLSSAALVDKRKWAIVIAFVVAAILTPPDPISQIGLAVPTILLYEISIWAARMVERQREQERVKKEKKDAADAAAEKAKPTEAETAEAKADETTPPPAPEKKS